eukprot:XP_001709119.1 Hypothetical protein GL50803_39014 [Giardia lamblia ATCC 50803]
MGLFARISGGRSRRGVENSRRRRATATIIPHFPSQPRYSTASGLSRLMFSVAIALLIVRLGMMMEVIASLFRVVVFRRMLAICSAFPFADAQRSMFLKGKRCWVFCERKSERRLSVILSNYDLNSLISIPCGLRSTVRHSLECNYSSFYLYAILN